MKIVEHHSFTLWVHSDDFDGAKVAVRHFDESESYDSILLQMLALDELGLYCSLTCDSWSTCENNDVEGTVK